MKTSYNDRKAPPAHALTDLHGRFLSVDDGFCELIRRQRSDVLGRTILELTEEPYRATNAEKLDGLREGGGFFVIRKTYLCGDGRSQKVENTVSLLTDGIGGSFLAASVIPVLDEFDPSFAATIGIARRLLEEHKARASLSAAFHDWGWRLLLAAYILEAEGEPVWARDVSKFAGGNSQANLLRIWELVQEGALVIDGDPSTLERVSVCVSVSHVKLLDNHLANVLLPDSRSD